MAALRSRRRELQRGLRSDQLGLFAVAEPPADSAVTRRLREVDVHATTPMQALTLLEELKKMAEES